MTDMLQKGRHRYVAHQGEANGRAILRAVDVRTIRLTLRTGAASQRALARRFNVSRALIYNIDRGIAWAQQLNDELLDAERG